MGNIQEPQEIGTKEEAEAIGKQMAEKVAKKVKFPQLLPQPLEGGELLAPEEREVALDDMRERASCGDSEQEPSLDDCVYIGAVYQLEKDKTKLRASPQPLDDEGLRKRIAELPVTLPTGAPKQFVGTDLADEILALLQPKIEQERERIKNWLYDFLWLESPIICTHLCNNKEWQALSGRGKEQL